MSQQQICGYPLWQILAAGCIVAATFTCVVLLYLFEPSSTHFFPVCPFYGITGLECAGCGSTRALYHLLHGDLGQAMRFNILFVLAIPALPVLLLLRRAKNFHRFQEPLGMLCAAIVLVFAVVRNLIGI